MGAMDKNLVFFALADKNRRALLERIYQQSGRSLAALSAGLGPSRQAMAKHMKILQEAELVVSRKVGRERRHYLNPLTFRAVAGRWLKRFEQVRIVDLMPEEEAGLASRETTDQQF
jgi:DNA-binding transcriptional ArsR family regulator